MYVSDYYRWQLTQNHVDFALLTTSCQLLKFTCQISSLTAASRRQGHGQQNWRPRNNNKQCWCPSKKISLDLLRRSAIYIAIILNKKTKSHLDLLLRCFYTVIIWRLHHFQQEHLLRNAPRYGVDRTSKRQKDRKTQKGATGSKIVGSGETQSLTRLDEDKFGKGRPRNSVEKGVGKGI